MKSEQRSRRPGECRGKHNDTALLYAFLIPAVLVVFVVTVVPLCYAFVLSFQEYNLAKPQDAHFIGLQNYIAMFSNSAVLTSILNTFVFSVVSVSITILLGLFSAIVVNQLDFGKSFFRIAVFSPMMLTPVVVGIMWKFLLNNQLGIIKYLLSLVGMSSPDWLGNPKWAMATIIMVDVWQWTSYAFLLILAGLESMNTEPIESARIDGANALQVFWYIKLPSLMPVIQVAAIFRLIWAFRNFDTIFTLTKGGPGLATETISLSIWRFAFQKYDIGMASSLSVLIFIILMLIAIGILRKTFREEQ
jgi:multiple sugar transport system permease protein